ncbi:ABC-2 family transporter protein [Dethiosulfatibacter aminovorans DSM 17477]|uniref:ABC-2 family transporter protein n=1 Tax=Dethiosulfatibacter aminovorans DSM 17477 TaxID=1121476 RepID=A0A1M6HB91_9FIRM|nr:ABC transporter permease [Dethiosulfatibacter aminovorans]SHJ19460.1 ABC-2 family transporter protein [Dethiosulfatibacter aminovorans DSM 17477]
MGRRFYSTLKKDMKIAWREYFFHVTIITAAVFCLVLKFIIPYTFENITFFVYMEEGALPFAIDGFESEFSSGNLTFVDSREDLVERVGKNTESYGAAITKGDEYPEIELVLQGYENSRFRNLIELQVERGLSEFLKGNFFYRMDYRVKVLNPQYGSRILSYSDVLLPLFIVMESSFIGYFLIAVLLFMEKEQRMHTAFLVSPGRAGEHLLSKVVVMLVLGLISAFGTVIFLRGFDFNPVYLFMFLAVSSFFGSSLGLLIGSFFDTLSKSTLWVMATMAVIAIPVISYIYPAFAPIWVKVIPTYTMIYAAAEAFVDSGGGAVFYKNLSLILVEGMGIFALAHYFFRRALLRKN